MAERGREGGTGGRPRDHKTRKKPIIPEGIGKSIGEYNQNDSSPGLFTKCSRSSNEEANGTWQGKKTKVPMNRKTPSKSLWWTTGF